MLYTSLSHEKALLKSSVDITAYNIILPTFLIYFHNPILLIE